MIKPCIGLNPKPIVKSITLSESFSGLLKTRPLAKTKRFRLHVLHGSNCIAAMGLDSTDTCRRYGVLVPKRLVRRAVDRNALKRLCREACKIALGAFTKWEHPNISMAPQPLAVLICLTQTTHSVLPSEHSAWLTELHQLFDCLG